MRNRTWPVFVIGLGSLLLLIFLPGTAALRQSAQIFDDVRRIQASYEATQLALTDVERRILMLSSLVRDFLLDDAPDSSEVYKSRFENLERQDDSEIADLYKYASTDQKLKFSGLKQQVDAYFESMRPVFTWTPEERKQRATYFLREQQRPRRQSILAIAQEISRLNAESYRRQYEEINFSQVRYRRQMQMAVALAFCLGFVIAGASILRISVLERHEQRHRAATQRAESEMRSLSARLMHAQEEERHSISRELHDEVGQTLTALRIQLGGLEKVRNLPGNEFRSRLDDVKSLAEQTMRTVRDLAMGLRPSVLDLGLEPALQWQARHFSRRTGITVQVEVSDELPVLPPPQLICVYRIVQEALTNAARHSGGDLVRISVVMNGEDLVLRITDNGGGLPPDWQKRRGLGLIGMEERARELGGSATVGSAEGKGLKIEVRLPMAVAQQA